MAYKMPDGDDAALAARTRAAFSDRNVAFNDLRAAKLDETLQRQRALETRAEAEQAAAAQALEVGNWQDHALRQKNMTELAVARARAEDEQRYWQNQPVHPSDPVEALIQSKAAEPLTQQWLRSHPSEAVALATGSDSYRVAKIQASHADAIAQGHVPGSAQYFSHIDRLLGAKSATRGSDNEGDKRVVRVVKQRQPAAGENELSPGELRAATEDVLWGREGGAKCGTPIGVEEYIKRRNAMRKTPGWFDKLQD
jgi:hypothetical protein